MFKGVIAEANSFFGSVLVKKLESPLFKDLFTISHSLATRDDNQWLEIIPQIDIIFFSANSLEFSEEVVQLINIRIKEKKLTLFFFRFVNSNNIARQLNFYKENLRNSNTHYDCGSSFKLNFNDFNKLLIDNYYKLSFNVQYQLNQFIDIYDKEIKIMKENKYVSIGNEYMNSVIVKDLTCKDDWFILADNLDKSGATILLHKQLKVCFCHWYFRPDDNEFSNSLLKLTFSYVLYDHLNEKNIIKYCNNLMKCQKKCLMTDIDIINFSKINLTQ